MGSWSRKAFRLAVFSGSSLESFSRALSVFSQQQVMIPPVELHIPLNQAIRKLLKNGRNPSLDADKKNVNI
jgi:hypothetical protein